MGLIGDIASAADIEVYRSGPMELISGADLGRLLAALRSVGITVLGVEGFRVVDGCLVPDMDAIADFSSFSGTATYEQIVDAAMRFESSVGKSDLLYEVTLDASDCEGDVER